MSAPRLREGLPVAPGALPLIGHLPRAFRSMPALIRRAHAELGPLFWITPGFGVWILFHTGPGALDDFRNKSLSSAHLPRISPTVAGESILSHDGARHRKMRAAMNKPFHPRGLGASEAGATMARVFTDLAARWADRGEARVLPDIQEATLEVIFRMLGVGVGDLPAWRAHYRDLLLANLGISVDLPGSPARRAARAKAWIDARFREFAAAARSRAEAPGLLSALAHAEDDEGARLSEDELVDNLRLLVLGGHETISSTTAWITVHLAARPDLWDALAAEARAASVPTTPEEAKSFPFAEALFRETVRMHPPFGSITRVADADLDLEGRRIPQGTMIGIDLWSASHDAATFPDPDAFTPARWLGRSGPPSAIEISQFGVGAHFCLGYHLAWLEAVEFTVALCKTLGERGLRPSLKKDRVPEPIYLPTEHPPAKTKVQFS
jgi:cytochrome P450 family 117 subfamily A